MLNTNNNSSSQESIAIIGGGMMGIVSAMYLAKSGRFQVTLFEKDAQIGGLSSSYHWQVVIWDRYYHVILSTDAPLLEFVKELHLGEQLFWQDTKTGFYGEGKLVSMSSTFDFLTFPFMSLWQKFRMGLGILYASQLKNASKLDKIYVRTWLTNVFGRRVYERIWEPLLRSKLGDARERTSAAFIWAIIARLYGARSAKNKQEKMGHVHGGYHAILQAAEHALHALGVTIVPNTTVLQVDTEQVPSSSTENIQHQSLVKVITDQQTFDVDNVLFTVPCPDILQILAEVPDDPYWQQLRQVEYLGVACVLLVLSRKLSPYYVINLLDQELPFTGIIEATNVVSPDELGGRHLVYLPKYMPQTDPANKLSDKELSELFIARLKKVFPDLRDEEILHTRVFRSQYVQPLQELNYLDRTIGFKTPLHGVYLVNTSMIYNSTLNNNAVVSLATEVVEMLLNDTSKLNLAV